MDNQPLLSLISQVSDFHSADLILYAADIDRSGYERISSICSEEKRRENAVLILSTRGGDPHAAYRIARAITHHYSDFKILVPGLCKSAGTLVALGACEIIMSDQGEFGPLDVQVQKQDEIFELGSGLDLIQSLNNLQSQTLESFKANLIELKINGGMTTKMAAEVGTKLTVGLFAPIYGQVDPVRLGELQRAIAIAHAYGARLSSHSKNLKSGALHKLVAEYPSHGFVIDRKEARELFNRIRASTPDEENLAAMVRQEHTYIGSLTQLLGTENETPNNTCDTPEASQTGNKGSEQQIIPIGARGNSGATQESIE